AAVLAGLLAAVAYPLAVRALPGPQELHSPPFLTARVLADGPGRSFLADACGHGRPFALCAFRAADLADADSFLWEETVGTGVYRVATLPVREQLRAEQMRFVAGVFANAPFRQLGASLGNWGRQLAAFYVEEPITAQGEVFAKSVTRVPGAEKCLQDGACDSAFSVGGLQLWHGLLLALAIGFLGWRLTRADVRSALGRDGGGAGEAALQSVAAAGLILGFLLVNAAVCGMLSGPAPRYEARVAWLVPALAGVLAYALPRPAVETSPRAVWRGLRAAAAPLSRFDRPVLRFAVVGGSGFVLDASLTYGLVHFAGLGPIPARLCAFSVAVCFTWLLNRHWTFAARRSPRPLKEALAYALVQGLGAAANLSVYAGALSLAPRLEAWLIVPLVLGAATGMSLTYLGSKHVVFARRALG
ncbi:GtrA family protein, partial [Caulobacter sp. 17J65-9]|uniref:GtrA family protein n=1 Tax=Caulobacter sp. 17J65-9 TaxID=2709382 RepID=UPI0013CD547E